VKKHLRGNQMLGTESRIEEVEAPIHASNVLLWSEKIEKPVRTRMRWVGDGGSLFDSRDAAQASFSEVPKRIRKVRWAPKSEEIFD
jgi:ribosomal protein L24